MFMEYKVLDVAIFRVNAWYRQILPKNKDGVGLTEREKLVTPMAKAGYYTLYIVVIHLGFFMNI